MKSTYNMSLFCLLNIMSGNNDCCSCIFNQFKEMLPNSIIQTIKMTDALLIHQEMNR